MRGGGRSRGTQLTDGLLWGASSVLLILSFVLSWGPPPPLGPAVGWSDKVWHFLGYGALCGFLLLAAVRRPGRGAGRFPQAAPRVAVLVLVVAWLTEALQAPFHRDVQLLDAGADLAGVMAGLLVWKGLNRRVRDTGRVPPATIGPATSDPTSGSSGDPRSGRTPHSGEPRSR